MKEKPWEQEKCLVQEFLAVGFLPMAQNSTILLQTSTSIGTNLDVQFAKNELDRRYRNSSLVGFCFHSLIRFMWNSIRGKERTLKKHTETTLSIYYICVWIVFKINFLFEGQCWYCLRCGKWNCFTISKPRTTSKFSELWK